MKQNGLYYAQAFAMDDLYYGYLPNSNKLKGVLDLAGPGNTPLGDFRTAEIHPDATYKQTLTGAPPPPRSLPPSRIISTMPMVT